MKSMDFDQFEQKLKRFTTAPTTLENQMFVFFMSKWCNHFLTGQYRIFN